MGAVLGLCSMASWVSSLYVDGAVCVCVCVCVCFDLTNAVMTAQ